jgi:hypothetical protein
MMLQTRKIAHYRVGGKIVFAEADLTTYLDQCRVETGEIAPHRPSGGVFKNLDPSRLSRAWKRQGASS